MKRMTDFSLTLNVGFVVRGEAADLQRFALAVQDALEVAEGRVKLVYKTTSADKLWIKAGNGGPAGGGADGE